MSLRARLALRVGLCWIAAACATAPSPRTAPPPPDSTDYYLRKQEEARLLAGEKRFADSLRVSQEALARCDQSDWCRKDARFQGSFNNSIGAAEEGMGQPDKALQHYRKAFYSYPLFFSENYFRLLKEKGMFRLLRSEIDVKLAREESGGQTSVPLGTSNSGQTQSICFTRRVAGIYNWRMWATSGTGTASGKAVVTQSGCAFSSDLASPDERLTGGALHLSGDVSTSAATLASGPPCASTDKGQIIHTGVGFTLNAERTSAVKGCLNGPYLMEFAKIQRP